MSYPHYGMSSAMKFPHGPSRFPPPQPEFRLAPPDLPL